MLRARCLSSCRASKDGCPQPAHLLLSFVPLCSACCLFPPTEHKLCGGADFCVFCPVPSGDSSSRNTEGIQRLIAQKRTAACVRERNVFRIIQRSYRFYAERCKRVTQRTCSVWSRGPRGCPIADLGAEWGPPVALPPPAKDMSQGDILANQSKGKCSEGQRSVGSTCPAVEKRHSKDCHAAQDASRNHSRQEPTASQKQTERTQTAYCNYVLELMQ